MSEENKEEDLFVQGLDSLIQQLGKTLTELKQQAENIKTLYVQSKQKPDIDTALSKLNWRKFPSGQGEWTFLTDQEDKLLPEFEPLKDFIEEIRQKGDVVHGGYKYRISRDKFLNRYPAGGG